jgi:hypothetical protein
MPTEYSSTDQTVGQLLAFNYCPIRIPEWQRNYSWTTSHAQTFWSDLHHFQSRFPGNQIDNKTYFLGSIVQVNLGAERLLLDGQQRLTTATILLSVIRDFLRRFQADAATQTQSRYIADVNYLTNSYSYNLTLNQFDRDFFRREIQELAPGPGQPPQPPAEATIESHRLVRAVKNYFVEEFEAKYAELGGGQMAHNWALRVQSVLLHHMAVVAVTSQDENRAAEVFETLNDRGIGLSAQDLLRNLILRRAHINEHQPIIDAWSEILEVEEEAKLGDYLRHFWLSRYGDVKARSLYREIKNDIEAHNRNSLSFTRTLQADAQVYRDLLSATSDNPEVRRLLTEVSDLGAAVLLPTLMSIMAMYTEEADRVRTVSKLIATYVRRIVIGNMEAGRFETLVYNLAKDIRNGLPVAESLTQLREGAPTDERFLADFQTVSLPRTAQARYILKKLEQHIRATQEVAVEAPDRVHVEHIYPQTPQQGERWADHNLVINRIGNLTLLARRLNTQIRNGNFEAKRPAYSASDLRLTNSLMAFPDWNTARVNERQNTLATYAVQIWNFVE